MMKRNVFFFFYFLGDLMIGQVKMNKCILITWLIYSNFSA